MDENQHDEMLMEIGINSKVAAQGITRLEQWAKEHEEKDESRETRINVRHDKLNLKVAKVLWTWGIVSFIALFGLGLLSVPVIARALGLG